MIKVVIALLVIVIVARLILKGYRAEPVLFIAGLTLMICTWFTGWGTVLPKGCPAQELVFLILSKLCAIYSVPVRLISV